MPCVQAPKNQPPQNSKGGPFETLDECEKAVGKGGCPCCSPGDCGPPQKEGNTLIYQCCGKDSFNPAWPPEEQFQKGECFPGPVAFSICIPNECSIEDYVGDVPGCEITAGVYNGDTCTGTGNITGCPEGSYCIAFFVCPQGS